MHEKYNYTIGFNVDPSKSTNETLQPSYDFEQTEYYVHNYGDRLPNVLGDSIISTIEQNVVNFSPTVNFNYNFGQRTNLRIDYSGTTTQPTANQLRDYTDYSNPQNTVTGNPELKPGYRNNFSARFDKFVPTTQLFYNFRVGGNFSFNDVGSVTVINRETGVRATTYENLNGNWNANFMGMFNTPLKNKKFSVNNFLSASYQNRRNYTNALLNTVKTLNLSDRAGINYRSDLFDVGVGGSIGYMDVVNEIQPDNNQQTYDLGINGNTTWYLPKNFSINTDINWSGRRGYSEAVYNTNVTIWNASVTKQVFNKKFGTGSVRLKIYDILQQQKNISRRVTDGSIIDSETNNLQSFFMCTFIYRFNIFPGGGSATQEDFDQRRGGRDRDGGRGGRPF